MKALLEATAQIRSEKVQIDPKQISPDNNLVISTGARLAERRNPQLLFGLSPTPKFESHSLRVTAEQEILKG